jgi:hypothetical protein
MTLVVTHRRVGIVAHAGPKLRTRATPASTVRRLQPSGKGDFWKGSKKGSKPNRETQP